MGLTLCTSITGSRNLKTQTLISKKLDKICHCHVLVTCSFTWISKTLEDQIIDSKLNNGQVKDPMGLGGQT